MSFMLDCVVSLGICPNQIFQSYSKLSLSGSNEISCISLSIEFGLGEEFA